MEFPSSPAQKKAKVAKVSAEKWVACLTEHPTTYGCNRGRTYLTEELWHKSDTTVHECLTEADALTKAKELRASSEYFEGYDGDGTFGANPPYDSADVKNWDNDTEILIEVMTLAAFIEREAWREEKIRVKHEELQRVAVEQEEREKAAIVSAGKVHYSWPARPDVDVPAELELHLGKGEHAELDSAKAASVKSLMIEENDRFSPFSAAVEGVVPLTDEAFGTLLAQFPSLEELHWHHATMTDERVEAILTTAPHLPHSLRVLRIPRTDLDPGTLALLAEFKALQTLDLCGTFTTLHYNVDDDDAVGLPYDAPLLACVRAMPNLKELELGNWDQEIARYMFDYAISRHVVFLLMASKLLKTTMLK
jgi:hypothetical protein